MTVRAVYPGHPLVILACIMDVYPSPAEALARTEANTCACLGHSEVPGAGSHVWAAVDLVRMLQRGATVDEVIDAAARSWRELCRDHYADRIAEGQAQADEFADGVRAMAEEWAAHSSLFGRDARE